MRRLLTQYSGFSPRVMVEEGSQAALIFLLADMQADIAELAKERDKWRESHEDLLSLCHQYCPDALAVRRANALIQADAEEQ